MIPGLIGAGMGLGVAGSLAGAYGQSQAAKSMAGVKRQQIDENERINQAYLQKVRASMGQQSPAATLGAAYSVPNAAAQAEIAKLGGVAGGLGDAATQNAAAHSVDTQNRLASLGNAMSVEQSRAALLEAERQAAELEAQRLNEIYASRLQTAANAGQGWRTGGALMGLGGAGLSLAGMYGSAGKTAPTTAPAPKLGMSMQGGASPSQFFTPAYTNRIGFP